MKRGHNKDETLPQAQDMHARAAESAKETRKTTITVASGAVGVLFIVVSRDISPALTWPQVYAVVVSIVFFTSALGLGIWFAFCDAQWSFWWGCELDQSRPPKEREAAAEKKRKWHTRKGSVEVLSLAGLFCGFVAAAVFVLARVFTWGS
jgi:hypothetical protein